MDAKNIEREPARENETLSAIRREIEKVIVCQTYLIERLLVGLLCNQHVLIEGRCLVWRRACR